MDRFEQVNKSFKTVTALMIADGATPPKEGETLTDWFPRVAGYIESLHTRIDEINLEHRIEMELIYD